MGPIQEEAKRGAGALVGVSHPVSVARLMTAEANTLWVLLAVSVANIALGALATSPAKYPDVRVTPDPAWTFQPSTNRR